VTRSTNGQSFRSSHCTRSLRLRPASLGSRATLDQYHNGADPGPACAAAVFLAVLDVCRHKSIAQADVCACTSSLLVSFPSCSPPFLPRPLLLIHRPLLSFSISLSSSSGALRLPPTTRHRPRPRFWHLNVLLLEEAPPQGGGPLLACSAS
jgi:hypothetical protein